MLEGYEISAADDHDVYDSFVLALGRANDTDVLLTADTDFETLCADEDVTYRNPIPPEKRARLALVDG